MHLEIVEEDLGTTAHTAAKTQLELDMREVSFIDSTAVAVLLKIRRRVAGVCGSVTLRGVQPDVMNVLRVSGLDRAFRILQ